MLTSSCWPENPAPGQKQKTWRTGALRFWIIVFQACSHWLSNVPRRADPAAINPRPQTVGKECQLKSADSTDFPLLFILQNQLAVYLSSDLSYASDLWHAQSSTGSWLISATRLQVSIAFFRNSLLRLQMVRPVTGKEASKSDGCAC